VAATDQALHHINRGQAAADDRNRSIALDSIPRKLPRIVHVAAVPGQRLEPCRRKRRAQIAQRQQHRIGLDHFTRGQQHAPIGPIRLECGGKAIAVIDHVAMLGIAQRTAKAVGQIIGIHPARRKQGVRFPIQQSAALEPVDKIEVLAGNRADSRRRHVEQVLLAAATIGQAGTQARGGLDATDRDRTPGLTKQLGCRDCTTGTAANNCNIKLHDRTSVHSTSKR